MRKTQDGRPQGSPLRLYAGWGAKMGPRIREDKGRGMMRKTQDGRPQGSPLRLYAGWGTKMDSRMREDKGRGEKRFCAAFRMTCG